MDKGQKIEQILFELTQLDAKTAKQLPVLWERQFGWKGDITADSLSEWDEEQFDMLYQIASGMRLTREYVPNITKNYQSVQQLNSNQSQVSFGQISSEDKEKLERMERLVKSRPDAHYGAYEIPPTIRKLYELEREHGLEWLDRRLGLMPVHNDMRYTLTPGMDGIHYCFITDFGMVKDLEEAYIAVVSPMDYGSHIWLVARNIRDFMRLWCSDRAPMFNHFADENAYRDYVDVNGVTREKAGPEQLEAEELLKAALNLGGMDDISGYLQQLREQRAQDICIRTRDAVGVVPLSGSEQQAQLAALPLELNDAELLEDLLRHAAAETKLAVLRDLQFTNRIYERRAYRLAKRILEELKLYYEWCNLEAGRG
jgi:hypothetical protein